VLLNKKVISFIIPLKAFFEKIESPIVATFRSHYWWHKIFILTVGPGRWYLFNWVVKFTITQLPLNQIIFWFWFGIELSRHNFFSFTTFEAFTQCECSGVVCPLQSPQSQSECYSLGGSLSCLFQLLQQTTLVLRINKQTITFRSLEPGFNLLFKKL